MIEVEEEVIILTLVRLMERVLVHLVHQLIVTIGLPPPLLITIHSLPNYNLLNIPLLRPPPTISSYCALSEQPPFRS